MDWTDPTTQRAGTGRRVGRGLDTHRDALHRPSRSQRPVFHEHHARVGVRVGCGDVPGDGALANAAPPRVLRTERAVSFAVAPSGGLEFAARRPSENLVSRIVTAKRRDCVPSETTPNEKKRNHFLAGIRTPEGRVKADNDNHYITKNIPMGPRSHRNASSDSRPIDKLGAGHFCFL